MEAVMCFEHDSSFLPTKEDRISELPDDIMVYILSFLPLKMAVATSAVARRWSDLWKHTSNLVFVHKMSEKMINLPVPVPNKNCKRPRPLLRSRKNVKWVNLVLKSHKALSLKEFTLSLYVNKESYFQYCKWLDYAFSRRVERLELDFDFSSCDCDLDKVLAKSSISINNGARFLKELKLTKLGVSGESMESFLANCPLLERLILENVLVKSDVMVRGGLLKHLDLKCHSRPRTQRASIRVSAPNLTRLRCIYYLDKLFLENVPNLIHADFTWPHHVNTMHRIAKTATQLEILSISLPSPTQALPVPQMPKLKELVVEYHLVDENFVLSITSLIQASPLLEKFILKIDDKYMDNNCGKFPIQEVDFKHRSLRVFEFSGFYGEAPDHLELVRYIVDNCVALEKITIFPLVPFRDMDEHDIANYEYIYDFRSRFLDMASRPEEVASLRRDPSLHVVTCIERVFAGNLPHHIKLHLMPSHN